MKNNPLKILVYVVIASAIAGALWNIFASQKDTDSDVAPVTAPVSTDASNANTMCFYNATPTKNGLVDKSYIAMQITGNKVTGELHTLPAEKDKKEGIFEGTVDPMDDTTKTQLLTAWWDSSAEGMANTEELVIEFNTDGAQVGYGDMLPQGDDVYTYKDMSKVTYGAQMTSIDCGSLNEILSVEKYINDNINTIAKDKAADGSTWQVTTVNADPKARTAQASYTDGHMKNTAQISYIYDTGSGHVTISSFTPATPTTATTIKKK